MKKIAVMIPTKHMSPKYGRKQETQAFRVSPPIGGHDYVYVSAVYERLDNFFNLILHETYIFESNSAGEMIDTLDLEGSQRGVFDVKQVLRDLGYSIFKHYV